MAQKIPDATVFCDALPTTPWLHWVSCPYTDRVAVFRFWLGDNIIPDYQKTALQPDEINQAQRYFRPEDRNRFVCARHMLRVLAGRYTNQNPNEIRFTIGTNKKPEIEGVTNWHINASHSGRWVLVAVGVNSVGVDIEECKPDFAFQDVLAQSFSEPEQHFVQLTNSCVSFYELWTRKEALVKATAKGLDDDFLEVPCLDGVHQVRSNLIGATGYWTVRSFTMSDGYSAAVAYSEWTGTPTFYTVGSDLFG